MTLHRYQVRGTVRLNTGKNEKFATEVQAVGATDARAKATAEAYHAYGTQNVKGVSFSVSPMK